jgi:tetratricopeptide (TPR) repeat protein
MSTTALPARLAFALAVLAACALPGCASLETPKFGGPDVTSQRKARKEAAVREFEQNRDKAEYEAALARYQQDDLAGCREALQRLLNRNPQHHDALVLMASIDLADNSHDKARDYAQKALQSQPNDPRVQYVLGLLADSEGRTAEAAVFYERAAKLDPSNEVYAVSSANARNPAAGPSPPGPVVAAAATVDAATAAKQVLPAGGATAHDPAAPGAAPAADPQAVAEADWVGDLFRAADVALDKGAPEIALTYYREAIAHKPRDSQVVISAAVNLLRRNQPDLAINLLSQSAARTPDCAAVHRTLGAAYYRQGNYRAAQTALQQALSLDKSSALSYFLMGCTLAKLGQAEAAGTHFRQARTLDPRYSAER